MVAINLKEIYLYQQSSATSYRQLVECLGG